MRWLRTLVIFDKGGLSAGTDWDTIHRSYVRAIGSIDFPEGAGELTLRQKSRRPDGQWNRNGVGYLRGRFLREMVDVEGWRDEGAFALERDSAPQVQLYPGMVPYQEPITSGFGDFDFVTVAPQGATVAIEWETGNVSSSHRSMNKLAIALATATIDAGVLIVPSRGLYEHLTDRIGNIGELSGYLSLWQDMGARVERGLLAITVVEQDALTEDPAFPYLPSGNDGRAAEGRARWR